MKLISSGMSALRRRLLKIDRISVEVEELKICQGATLVELHRAKKSRHLKDYEFKVFSQWGEDGIIQHLLDVITIQEPTFIEFGVEDFFESNCRFLLMKDNWRGFVIDGSRENISKVKNSHYYWKHDLTAVDAFITRENINDLLARSSFGEDLGILSIDLDGNDYYIFEAIQSFRPRIIICEYNAIFGPSRKIAVPYDALFVRSKKHHSNLYYGASLGAIAYAAIQKGYSLIGTNSAGNNVFFVRNDLVNEHLEVLSVADAFTQSNFRESRDEIGNLTFLAGEERLKRISGLPVLDVETNVIESL